MKPPTVHAIPLPEPLAAHLADWLLASAPATWAGDLTGALVVLPSVRACATLRHTVLERSGRDVLLLPDLLTPKQLAAQLAWRLGLGAAWEGAPPGALRPLLLAGRLRELAWVHERPESADGLAAELIRAFDEARRGDAAWLLDAAAAPGDAGLDTRPAEVYRKDVERLRAAFAAYRRVVTTDETDVLLAVAARLGNDGAGWPGPPYARVAVAGFAELDAAVARLLRAALAQGEGHVFAAGTDDPLSRALLGTFGEDDAPSHPLAPAGRVRAALRAGAAAHVPAAGAAARPEPAPPELLSCGDPEEESRVVAGRVCEELVRRGGEARIAVATNDRALARRVVAQLRDAGVDADDTGGLPLATLPAGRLCHFLLQCAVTGVRHEPLLEVLTHPWVNLLDRRGLHSRRTLLLEKLVLRGEAPPAGLPEYRERAAAKDALYSRARGGAPANLASFVDAIESALAPLLRARVEAAPWATRLAALRAAWGAVAREHPLRPWPATLDEGGRDARTTDLVTLGDLLDRLERLAAAPGTLPDVARDDFAAEIDRLLAVEAVRPHRSPQLPVQVMGLLEARLERFDLLLLAGANEEVFPGRQRRPLFVGDAARRALGLPTWRDRLGEQGELFLRLLHAAERVVVTWSRERDGQPALPSPLVERLTLGLRREPATARPGPLFRERAPDLSGIGTAQAAFADEPGNEPLASPRIAARTFPLRHTSHSGLATYRECPYRFLLEKGYRLAEQEEVLKEFRRLDHGNAVHECLRLFLEPDGVGCRRLAAGDGAGALRELRRLAADQFAHGAGSAPQRRLWEEAFLAAAPAIVEVELGRAAAWRTAALEQEFRLTLGGLRAWIVAEMCAGDEDADIPAPPSDPPPARAAIALTGWIDRVDVDPAGAHAAVIDYKTGRTANQKAIVTGTEPQLTLYAVAVETGAVSGLAPGLRVAEAGYYVFTEKKTGLAPRLDLEGAKTGRAPLLAGAKRILADALAAADQGAPFPLLRGFRDGTLTGDPPCGHCPFRGVCRVDERELPPALRARLAQPPRSR